jgi:hypothetical protein
VKRLSQARRRRYFEIAAFRFCRGGASKDFRRGEMPYKIVRVGGAKGIGAQSCEPALRRLRFPSLWTVTPKPARTFTLRDLGQDALKLLFGIGECAEPLSVQRSRSWMTATCTLIGR